MKKGLGSVVVLGNHIQALEIIRSLGRHGIRTYLLNDKSLCLGHFSKYTTKFFKAPLKDENALLYFLMNELTNEKNIKGSILIPTNESMVSFISKNKIILENYYKVPTPDYEIINFTLDKKLTALVAEKIDIPTPKAIYAADNSKFIEEISKIKFPIIIKGIDGYEFRTKTRSKVFIVNSKEDFDSIYHKVCSKIDPSRIMIQEVIPGNPEDVYSFCSFFKNNELKCYWIGHKLREHPMGFGTGTLAESIKVPELVELGSRFLKAINYYGISEIEFKKDARTGKFILIEINPRTWLWHSLARTSGVEFPYILYKDMMEESINFNSDFKEGVKWIHFFPDLEVVIKEILRGRMNIKDYLNSLKGEVELAVFSWDDPIPFIAEILLLPYLKLVR